MFLTKRPMAQGIWNNLQKKKAWYRYGSAQRVYALIPMLIPRLAETTLIAYRAGMYLEFFVAPVTAYQREIARIPFLQVPAYGLAMLPYLAEMQHELAALAGDSANGWLRPE